MSIAEFASKTELTAELQQAREGHAETAYELGDSVAQITSRPSLKLSSADNHSALASRVHEGSQFRSSQVHIYNALQAEGPYIGVRYVESTYGMSGLWHRVGVELVVKADNEDVVYATVPKFIEGENNLIKYADESMYADEASLEAADRKVVDTLDALHDIVNGARL